MALPLLAIALGGLVFGGVAVAAVTLPRRVLGKSASRTNPLFGMLQPISMKFAPGTEKFMDPMFLCYGSTQPIDYTLLPDGVTSIDPRAPYVIAPNNKGVQADLGYGYLSGVPNKARARVAAMRAQINRGPNRGMFPNATSVDRGDTQLTVFVDGSRRKLGDYSRTLIQTYEKVERDAKYTKDLAATLGISAGTLQTEASTLLQSAGSAAVGSGTFTFLNDATRQWGPIAQTASSSIIEGVTLASKGDMGGAAVSAGLAILQAAALAIPYVGPIITITVGLIQGILDQKKVAAAEFCKADQEKIWSKYKQVVESNLPAPWHAAEIYKDDCPPESGSGYDSTPAQRALQGVFAKALSYGNDLNPLLRTQMQRWWSLAQIYMSDPQVKQVFDTLGYDMQGGIIASDEQVMLVAAPVATAFGFDVDKFAERLWDRSGGWRAVPSDKVYYTNAMRDQKVAADHAREFPNTHEEFMRKWRAGSGGWTAYCGDPNKNCLCNQPQNAWWVQWGVLAADAFVLAEELKAAGVKLEPDDPVVTSMPVNPNVTPWKPPVSPIGGGFNLDIFKPL